jgi:hypothetical protein
MRDELVRHKGGEGQIDQREGIDNRQQQPAAIFDATMVITVQIIRLTSEPTFNSSGFARCRRRE